MEIEARLRSKLLKYLRRKRQRNHLEIIAAQTLSPSKIIAPQVLISANQHTKFFVFMDFGLGVR